MATYSVQGPHPTDNLPGYPARDYMAPGGTPVYAWEGLRVLRVSGASGGRGKGFGGFNLYLQDRAGKNFFVTHLEGLRVKAGDVLRPGQQFASVGTYPGMATHVHVGYQGGDPVDALGLRPEYVFTPGGAVAGSTAITNATSKIRTTQSAGGYQGGPLSDVPVLGGAGRAATRGLDWLLSPVDKTLDVAKAPFNALQWSMKNWDRILEVGGGFIVLLIGLVLMGRSLGVTKTKVEIVEAAGRFQGQREYAAAGSPPPATREDLRSGQTHEVTDAGERRAARRARASGRGKGYDPETSEIPF